MSTRYALVSSDRVVAIIDAATEPTARDGVTVLASDTADVGWHLVDGVLTGDAPAPTESDLIALLSDRQNAILTKGVSIDVGAERPIACAGAGQCQLYIAAMMAWCTAHPTRSAGWWNDDDTTTPLTADQVARLHVAFDAWIVDVGNAAVDAIALIRTGTITSLAQVRDLAWPTA